MSKSNVTLEEIRHSASHVLAQAVQQLFPDALLGIGPTIENGFYYDFELSRPLSDDDLAELEKRMQSIIEERQEFEMFTLSREDAIKKVTDMNQPYKKEIIDDLDLPNYSFYQNGPFVDLCRGPHVQNTRQIGAFKLLKVSGAYWRGSEKNKMLQRIYGTAFFNRKELKAYLTQLEEAQKRDHRVLGKALDLFSIQDDTGGGLILWHPKGALVRHLIEDFWRKEHLKRGYDLLYTPHIGRAELWKTSGHLDFYNENMYTPIEVDEQDYFLKPMNCPFHILIYNNKPHSYRDLPLRYAELGTVYRYERSGVLHGLMRVRGFTQDDAHLICTKEQMHQEIVDVITFCYSMLKTFEFNDINVYISTRPEEKSVGNLSDWEAAEAALTEAVRALGISYSIDEGGGAFYGPKIDIKIKDAIGREWQCSTIQFDFNLPERFDMTYVGQDGKKHRPYMIHRALLGSIERFFGILVEHYAGKFPLWLAPVQVRILSLNDDVEEFCADVSTRLKAEGIRVETDFSNEKLGYKLRQSMNDKVPYTVIVGKNEQESGTLSLRKLGEKHDLGPLTVDAFISQLNEEVSL